MQWMKFFYQDNGNTRRRQTGGNIRATDQQAHRNTTEDLTGTGQNTGLKYKVDGSRGRGAGEEHR